MQRKLVEKVRFRNTPPSPTLIIVVPLSTRLVENRKTQHCPGGAGEGAIFEPSLKSTLKDKSVSTILTPIVGSSSSVEAAYSAEGKGDKAFESERLAAMAINEGVNETPFPRRCMERSYGD